MDNYIVSARKYRPITFSSVVGQGSITVTLKNAVKNAHLAHAYLFCGPRGVGKTTCARIFAKTINCSNLSDDFEPCNSCESCLSFNESRSFNIRELDAASNNSVDDIRNLIDQVRIPPQLGKYSVYVIDEVHMLSQAAFNAFLKTLEEPPAHAIFILATTEKHKIIPTILSRCQIFDFNRITVEDISKHLLFVAQSENVTAEIEALHVIAQKADGALRDALSIFDQIVSFSGNNITYKDVINNLNILDYEYFQKITQAFLDENIPEALLIFNEILNDGFDAQHFITGLSEYFRDILVSKDAATLQLLEIAPSIRDAYKFMASRCTTDFLLNALNIANQYDISYKTALNKRLHVEIALMKICRLNALIEKKNNEPEVKQEAKTDVKPKTEKNETITDKETVPPVQPEVTPITVQKKKTPAASVSLKKMIENNEKELAKDPVVQKVTEDEKAAYNKEFTVEELVSNWKNFAEKLKEDEPRTYFMLTSHLPELKENFKIEVVFLNDLQEDVFKKIKPEISSYLKKSLKNDLITIESSVKATPEDSEKKLYTDSEKYNHLVQQNPDLHKLRQQLNLDFQ